MIPKRALLALHALEKKGKIFSLSSISLRWSGKSTAWERRAAAATSFSLTADGKDLAERKKKKETETIEAKIEQKTEKTKAKTETKTETKTEPAA